MFAEYFNQEFSDMLRPLSKAEQEEISRLNQMAKESPAVKNITGERHHTPRKYY